MIRIIYTSVAAADFPSGEIFKIIEKSSSNNAESGLTGFLVFSSGRFFQVLEGASGDIDTLLAKIEADPRHHTIEIVDKADIAQRAFPKWRMKRLGIGADSQSASFSLPDLAAAPKAVHDCLDHFLATVRQLQNAA